MKMRLFVCVALAMMVAGASAVSSRLALAQGEPAKGRAQQAERDGARSEDSSSSIDKALRAYDERMDRDLDKCRHDLEQMKKELHELIDLRLSMAMSVAELRAGNSMQGGPFGRSGDEEGATRSAGERGQGPHGRGAGGPNAAEMARELQQLHNQLRSEIEQQQNQVAQLASQLRAMRGQGHQAQQGQHPGTGRPGQPNRGGERDAKKSDRR